MRVMSWNIGQAYEAGESRAQGGILERVAQVVEMERPRIVALQELAGADQLEVLLARLEGKYQGFLNEGGDSDRYTAILVRVAGDGLKIRFQTVRMSSGRDAAAAVFRLPRSQLRISALSVHADAWDPEARGRYTRDLVDWGRRQDYDVVFLAGDFNLEGGAGGRGEALFTRSQETDSASYAYITRHFRDLAIRGGDTALPGRRIDYVFARGGQMKVRRVAVLKGQRVGRMARNRTRSKRCVAGWRKRTGCSRSGRSSRARSPDSATEAVRGLVLKTSFSSPSRSCPTASRPSSQKR